MMNMRGALIMTTINVPENLRAWRDCLRTDDVIVVAGDHQTPHEDVAKLLAELPGENVYLPPQEQARRWPGLSIALSWKTIRRRNLATLAALDYDPAWLLTVDDDNWPQYVSPEFGDRIRVPLTQGLRDHSMITMSSGWYNAAGMLHPPVWHRGFPQSFRSDDMRGLGFNDPASMLTTNDAQLAVLALLWHGDPDVDALDRYRDDVEITGWHGGQGITLAPGTWCPFNGQAVAFVRQLVPAMFWWQHVGRYDDIWASFLTQRVMQELNLVARWGEPLVIQRRAEHTVRDFPALVRDLEQEMVGYRYNEEVIRFLRELDLGGLHSVTAIVRHIHNELYWYTSSEKGYWLKSVMAGINEWDDAIKATGAFT